VTFALLTTTVFGSSWRYLGRSGSLVGYRRDGLGRRERLLNSAHQLMQLPWFIRNVIVKVLLTLNSDPHPDARSPHRRLALLTAWSY